MRNAARACLRQVRPTAVSNSKVLSRVRSSGCALSRSPRHHRPAQLPRKLHPEARSGPLLAQGGRLQRCSKVRRLL